MTNMQPRHNASPRVVTTGGNSFPSELNQKNESPTAHIDWLAFTVRFSETKDLNWLAIELRQFLPRLVLKPSNKGWFGYKKRHTITHADFDGDLGLVAHGGENQRGTASIQLNAQACCLINDWQKLKIWCEENASKITRVDLAHDDFTGQVLSIIKAQQWLQDGLFCNNGMRKGETAVKSSVAGDWLTKGSPAGRTIYVGSRASGKLLRIYEKGKQLGDTISPWVRAEVELKDQDRIIPFDVLINPSEYLAAAYPALNYLSAIQHKIKTISKSVSVSLDAAIHHLRNMGGMLINVMMQKHGGDAFAVINELKREGTPKRLAKYTAHLPQYFIEAPV
jgi:phage replication initiation protein